MTDYDMISSRLSQAAGLDLFLLKLRYREGKLAVVEGNETLLLSDPDSVWVVYSGTVDVFAVPLEDGQVVGARSHIFRGGPGQVLLGMGLDGQSLGAGDVQSKHIGLLVTGMPDTRVLRMKRSRLQELATDLEFRAIVAAMLETWAAGLAEGIPTQVLPKEYVLLEDGQETVPGPEQVAVPKKGILWVKPSGGNAQFMGQPELQWADTERYLPVLSHTWLRATEQTDPTQTGQTRLQAVSTESFMQSDPAWSGLDQFHHLVLHAMVLNQERTESAEQERLKQKAEADDLLMENALQRLSSPLIPEAVAELAELMDLGGRQPLLVACRLVGKQLGLNIQTYPEMGKERTAKAMLRNIGKASHFQVRQVALRGEWWRTDSGPMVGFIEENKRPVAILPLSARSYEVVDPVERTKTPVTSEMDGKLSPFAFTFYRPFPNRLLTAWELLRFGLQGCKKDLLTVVLMGVAGGLLGLVPPQATKVIFNSIIPQAERGLLFQIGVALFLVALANGVFQVTRSLAMLRVQSRLDASVQAALWDRILSLPTPFFRKYSSGELGSRAMAISDIRRFLSGHIMTTILTSLFSVFSLILLFVYSFRLALVALALVLVAVLATVLASRLRVRYQRELSTVQGEISGQILQFLNGISKFRVAGAERQAFSAWAEKFAAQRKLAYKGRTVANALLVFNAGYPVLASLVIFAVVGASAQSKISAGDFLAFNLAFTQFLMAVLSLSSVLIMIVDIVPMFERTRPILEALPEIDELRADPGELTGHIEVSHVSFRYIEKGPLVLNDVSLSISPGDFVALVGPSGSGKSTMLRMLLGFETPESGGLYYDGQDLSGLDLRAVRQQIGVVLQNAKLMPGEIYANIVGANPDLTLDDAWEAARMAGLEQDIKEMTMGMNTVISEGGGNLSGGQRQRVLIARALASKPRLLFFDEATSALDNQTQAIVSRSLEEMKMTRLVIAHRLSTIMNADRIYVFENGRVVQSGTYQELIKRPGPFAELAKRQMV